MKFTIEIELDDSGFVVHKRDAQGKIIFNYEQFCAESYAMLTVILGENQVSMLDRIQNASVGKNHVGVLSELVEKEYARVFPSED